MGLRQNLNGPKPNKKTTRIKIKITISKFKITINNTILKIRKNLE